MASTADICEIIRETGRRVGQYVLLSIFVSMLTIFQNDLQSSDEVYPFTGW